MEADVLGDAVALVEDPQHGDALRHRSHAGLVGGGADRSVRRRTRTILLFAAASAAGKRKHGQQRSCEAAHVYSGVQGS
jgi:hypothetical protein